MIQDIKYQRGFTLIELMISLVLGLLISAAIIQVFITSQRVDRVQSAGSEIQDSAVFGIQSIEQQLRLANLGNDGVPINDKTAMGGVVLTASQDGADSVNILTKNQIKDGFLTRSHDMSSNGNNNHRWNGLTNTDVPSDQLTIQYTNTTGQILYDCEGKKVELNEHVISRYFLTEDDVETKKDSKNLNLNCDAGRIEKKGKKKKDIDDKYVNFGDIG
ncbi:PilW family protein, partial [Psychrobacter sp.]|uniref:PilW family protein n=1 Tax=Psychrobacter sp. TaxID=56811 RepID=UPI002FD8A229